MIPYIPFWTDFSLPSILWNGICVMFAHLSALNNTENWEQWKKSELIKSKNKAE